MVVAPHSLSNERLDYENYTRIRLRIKNTYNNGRV